jgi:protein gp37
MGENSAIGWTDHTFNPWTGCTKVSEACRNCYAESWAKRTGIVQWGDNAARRRTSESNWKQPLKWNREALIAGKRRRVFCASLADVFEERDELRPWRRDLFSLIKQTPQLDWLLLTKRPENILRMLSESVQKTSLGRGPLSNVWLGTTLESQGHARRIDRLVNCRGAARTLFLSCEPLLGPLDLFDWLHAVDDTQSFDYNMGIDWVICGGESGPKHRPLNLDYARSLRDQCVDAGVPFFFKQHGGRTPEAGGCELDGREWKQFPKAA